MPLLNEVWESLSEHLLITSYQLPTNEISGEDSREVNGCYRVGKEAKGGVGFGKAQKSVAGLGVTGKCISGR